MRIKFKAPDPRAGTTAQMDSSRGQHFVDTGAASLVKDGEAPAEVPAETAKDEASAPKAVKKTTTKKAG